MPGSKRNRVNAEWLLITVSYDGKGNVIDDCERGRELGRNSREEGRNSRGLRMAAWMVPVLADRDTREQF